MQLFYFSDVFSIRPVGKVILKMLIEPNSELNWFQIGQKSVSNEFI